MSLRKTKSARWVTQRIGHRGKGQRCADCVHVVGQRKVLWRFGKGGDFTITNPQVDPYPWFSGQHFPNLQGNYLTLFDNGNMRVNPSEANSPNSSLCCSRIQAWTLNESATTATLATNGSFNSYSSAIGATNRLTNGKPSLIVRLSNWRKLSMGYAGN